LTSDFVTFSKDRSALSAVFRLRFCLGHSKSIGGDPGCNATTGQGKHLVCPTAPKVRSARKREIQELSNCVVRAARRSSNQEGENIRSIVLQTKMYSFRVAFSVAIGA